MAPTEECVRLVEELGEEVRYIVLPTTAVRGTNNRGLSCVEASKSVLVVVVGVVVVLLAVPPMVSSLLLPMPFLGVVVSPLHSHVFSPFASYVVKSTRPALSLQ